MEEHRGTIRYPQKGKKLPVRVCDVVITEQQVWIEVKLSSKNCLLVPLEYIKGEIKHLLDEVKLEKEYN